MSNLIYRHSIDKESDDFANSTKIYSNLPLTTEEYKDFSAPLPFSQWVKFQSALDPNNLYPSYMLYLIEWQRNRVGPNITTDLLKTSYLQVIESLKDLVDKRTGEDWVRQLTISNDIDIHDAIEFYARKLKEIAIYFISKRNDAQRAKLKYNLNGSNKGLEKLFENYFLKAFTQREFIFNIPTKEIYSKLPQLSSVNETFKVIIEPTIDTTNYFDKNISNAVTDYFNVSATSLLPQFSSLDVESYFSYGIQGPGITDSMSSFDSFDGDPEKLSILFSLLEKFSAEVKQKLEIRETLTNDISATYDIRDGNNWFYWPSGEYIFEQDNLNVLPVELNATSLITNGATAAEEHEIADKIFVKIGDTEYQAAWLKFTPNTTTTQTMSAFIQAGNSFLFKYPYPGYGAASDTLPWTGPELTNFNTLYTYLSREEKKAIALAYFQDTSAFIDIDIDPIHINNTSIAYSNPTAGKTYASADKIAKRVTENPNKINDTEPSSVYNAVLQHSWLYDFTRTNLSIIGQQNILWPYTTFNTEVDYEFNISADVCSPVAVSAIEVTDLVGAVAGRALYDADTIYKLDRVDGKPIQCAYLFGPELSGSLPSTQFTSGIEGVLQPGVFLEAPAGVYSTLLWTEPDTDINDTKIKWHRPLSDSPIYKQKNYSIHDARNTPIETIYNVNKINGGVSYGEFGPGPGIGNWKTETYRTPLFSPIGHPGETYDDFDKMADVIFLDSQFPEPFTLDTWRDPNGFDYKTSPHFAWFQLTATPIYPDVGWGPGRWVNYNGTGTFTLHQGMQYKYLRANLRRPDSELDSGSLPVPPMIIKEATTLPLSTWEWRQCVLDLNGEWIETNNPTGIIANPGDVLVYDHANSFIYCVTADDTRGVTEIPVAGIGAGRPMSFWTDLSAVTLDTTIMISWPNISYDVGNVSSSMELQAVTWSLSAGNTLLKTWNNLTPGMPVTFIAGTTGTYTIEASGLKLIGGVEKHTFEIESTTSTFIAQPSGSLEYATINIPSLPVDVRIQLNGWDPEQSQYTGEETGYAKPFWAPASNELNRQTKFKTVSIYGNNLGFFNRYNVRTQPDIENWYINQGDVIEYTSAGDKDVNWIEDIEFRNKDERTEWKKLEILDETINPLQSFTSIDIPTIAISATNTTSPIILSPYTETCKDAVFINYYAQNGFTWTQQLSTIFTENIRIINDEVDHFPAKPYANSLNRHYPSVALIPDYGNITRIQNIGLFLPENIGFNSFYSYNYFPSLTTSEQIEGVYLNIDKFEKSYGYTLEENYSPRQFVEYDAQWMKRNITTFARSGEIKNALFYQKFTPYINSREIDGRENTTIDYEKDPWFGPMDIDWRDSTDFPPDFRGMNTIEKWYQSNISPTGIVYQYCDDVYNNHYYLFKDIPENISLTDQLLVDGELWVKTQTTFGKLLDVYSNIFDHLPLYTREKIKQGEVKNIYCFGDILYIVLDFQVVIQKLSFDYVSNALLASNVDFSLINLENPSISIFNETSGECFPCNLDVFTDLDNQHIYTAVCRNANTSLEIFKTDIQKVTTKKVHSSLEHNILQPVLETIKEDYDFIFLDRPSISYNKYNKLYTITFFANGVEEPDNDEILYVTGQHLVTIKLVEKYNTFEEADVSVINPTSKNKLAIYTCGSIEPIEIDEEDNTFQLPPELIITAD